MLEVRVYQCLGEAVYGVGVVATVGGPGVADEVLDVPVEGLEQVPLDNQAVHVLALMFQSGDGQPMIVPPLALAPRQSSEKSPGLERDRQCELQTAGQRATGEGGQQEDVLLRHLLFGDIHA